MQVHLKYNLFYFLPECNLESHVEKTLICQWWPVKVQKTLQNGTLTLKKKDKIDQKIKDQFLNDEDDASYSSWIDSRPTTNLEKLHFITGRVIFMEEHIQKRPFRSLSTYQQTSIWSYWDVFLYDNYSICSKIQVTIYGK